MVQARNLYANKKVAMVDGLIVLACVGILSYTNHSLNTTVDNSRSYPAKSAIRVYSESIRPNWNGSTVRPILVNSTEIQERSIVSHYY